MTFADLFAFLLLSAGIQYAIGGAALTAPFRSPLPVILRTLLECTACCGFWIGLILTATGLINVDFLPGAGPGILPGARPLAAGIVAGVGVPLIRYFGPDGGR